MKKVIAKVPIYAIYAFIIAIMFAGSPAFCSEVINETFSKSVMQGAQGAKVVGGEFVNLESGEEGWRATEAGDALSGKGELNYIEYNIKKMNSLTEGTIEFWVQRNRDGGILYGNSESPSTYDTLFEILLPDNSTLVSVMILWHLENTAESGLLFNHFDWNNTRDYGQVWGMVVPLGFKPAIGDWVHVALTFGENAPEDNKVFINGKLQPKRINIGSDVPTEPGNKIFSKYLSRSDRLRIGIETGKKENYPGGTSMLYHSVLSNFVIHDEIITEFNLDKFSFSGKPSNLTAEYTDPDVSLKWTPAISGDVEGYNVYKKDAHTGSFAKINEEPVEGSAYSDGVVENGKSYKYIVKGVNGDGNESNASNEAGITVVSEFYRVTETSKDYDPRNLTGIYKDGKIIISWKAPAKFVPAGYNVYRREGEGSAAFAKLNGKPLGSTSYTDSSVTDGGVYYYSVTALNAEGKEGKYPSEIKVEASSAAIGSVSVDPARAVKSGEEITVTASGTPGGTAALTIDGVVSNAPMKETSSGVYFGTVTAGAGSVSGAAVTVTMGGASRTASATVTIDNEAPSKIAGLDIRNDWENELYIDWQPASEDDVSQYNIYRSNEMITGSSGLSTYKVISSKDDSEYWDKDVTANMVYYYVVAAVDNAGNIGGMSEVVSAKAIADTALPVVYKIEDSTAGVTLREGDVLTLYVEAESGCAASFSVGDVISGVAMKEDSRVGRYTGSYTVTSADVVNDYIIVKLTDKSENSATYASDFKVNIDGSTKLDTTPPLVESISENSWSIAGFSGKLVEGDMLTVELVGESGGVAYFDIAGVAEKVRMTESGEEAGKYIGSYTVKAGDYGLDTTVTGYLADAAGNITSITASSKLTVDTTINIEVTASKELVPADEKTRVDIVAKATDLNGDAVAGHKIAFTLTTTDEYTGIIGSGRYSDFEDVVGGSLRVEWRGETDAFGEVNATYKAGFAAKTTVVVAKDLTSGDIGVGYIASYVSASIDITLLQQTVKRRIRKIGVGVYIQVTATPDKLTADGDSTSRIVAKVTDIKGQPVSGERIVFSMSSDNGSLVALDQETDNRGIAEAEYTAGTKMGTVNITALDTTAGISGSTMIVLMSDAPAKVYLSAAATSLPADGKSKTEINVKVSDINDNPNQSAVVEYEIAKGTGSLDMDVNETDRNGEAVNKYRAGMIQGTVTIQAKVISRIPSEDEVNRAKGSIFVGQIYDGFEEGEVKKWLKEIGDKVEKGEVIATVKTEMGDYDIKAKGTGKLHAIKKYKDDDFKIGETLGIIEVE